MEDAGGVLDAPLCLVRAVVLSQISSAEGKVELGVEGEPQNAGRIGLLLTLGDVTSS